MINVFGLEIEIRMIIVPLVYIIIGVVSYRVVKNIVSKLIGKRNLKGAKKQRIETLRTLIDNVFIGS